MSGPTNGLDDTQRFALKTLKEKLGEGYEGHRIERDGTPVATVAAGSIVEALTLLRDDPEISYRVLSDLASVDYGAGKREPRYVVVYNLLSRKYVSRLRLEVGVAEGEESVPTVTGIHAVADWLEREVFDLMGIRFEGHPDLRRIQLPEDYDGHPLRKEFPVRGGYRQVRRPEEPLPTHGHRFRTR
jgi:NADH-quinone oxidoreductase subunit C